MVSYEIKGERFYCRSQEEMIHELKMDHGINLEGSVSYLSFKDVEELSGNVINELDQCGTETVDELLNKLKTYLFSLRISKDKKGMINDFINDIKGELEDLMGCNNRALDAAWDLNDILYTKLK